MVIVVAVVVVLLLVVGAAWLVRRRGGDETHSVEGYRNTMDTLQGIRSRSSSGSVRMLGQDGEPVEGDTPDRPAGPVPAPGPLPPPTSRLPRPGGPGLIFEDPAGSPPPGGSLPSGGRRGQDRAISAMNHRPRRLGAPVAVAVVVVVLLVVVVVIGAQAQAHHHTTTSTTRAGGRSSQTTAPGGAAGKGGKGGKGSTPPTSTSTTTTSSTTTTVPSSFTPISSTATTGTYVPPAAAYSVTLTATTGQCWLTVRSAGATVFSQTLAAGQSKSLSMTGSSTIEIGAPSSLTVTMDHKPVVLPAGYQTPFVVTLQPAVGTSTTSTTGATVAGGTGTA